MKNFGNLLLACMAALLGACAGESAGKCDAVVRIDADSVVNRGYIGNGVQWDPYALDYGQGRVEISDADWAKLYARLDFMRPAFIRVMTNTTSVVRNGRLDRMRGFEHLSHILGYCQSRGVTVMFGDWGGSLMYARAGTVNRTLLDHAAAYVAWLVGEKGYDCIRYYNLVNEPNGFWSAADGDFDLWAKAVSYFRGRLDAEGLAGKVELVGPDAAIWGPEEAWWVSRSRDELGDRIGLYDIHTYPSKCTVNSGEYTRILEAYRREVPAGKKIVMGEIGFKFVEPADSLLQAENLRRAAAHPNASTDDSQMFVYDPMYGTDMADALFQTIHAGYSGCIAWMLDDAMHFKEAPDKLKIWGFWNIFGDEIFGARRGTGAPWYYAWSLLCRTLRPGSDFFAADVRGAAGVKAVAAVKDGRRTVAVVNVSREPRRVRIECPGWERFRQATRYRYGEGLMRTEGDHTLLPDATGLRIDFRSGRGVRYARRVDDFTDRTKRLIMKRFLTPALAAAVLFSACDAGQALRVEVTDRVFSSDYVGNGV